MTLRLLRFRFSVERFCRFTRANYLCDLRKIYRITITKITATARISDAPPMTGEQSKKLKVGDRVQWDNSLKDRGTVSEVDWRGVTIKWDDGRTNSIYHNDMAQVERVPTKLE
jgi:hypothetical protein